MRLVSPLERVTQIGKLPVLRAAFMVLLLPSGVWISAGQIYRLPNPNPSDRDFFGVSVSIDGTRTVVGASGTDTCGESSGAAHVYDRDTTSGHWNHVATLSPNDCMGDEFFGRSLSLSRDRVIVAAFRPTASGNAVNAAYIFELGADSVWNQVAKLSPERGREEGAFASAVALSGDHAVVSASGDAAAGAYHGAVYVYRRQNSGRWVQVARIVPDEDLQTGVFGSSADLDGNVLAVTASTYLNSEPGSLYLFEGEGTGWKQVARFRGLYDFFLPVDVWNGRVIVGEREAGRREVGRVSLFERSPDGSWRRTASLNSNPPYEFGAFGSAVAVHGSRALVAGYDEQLQFEFNIDRVVYVFEKNDESGSWHQRHIIDVGNVAFGSSIDIDGDAAVIGQASDGPPGSAYIVHLH
jgi:hypothetical protein